MLQESRQKLESEQRFRALIENGTDLILILDAEGICRYASPSQERILGFPLNEVMGKKAFELVHADDLSQIVETFQRALLSSRAHVPVAQYRMRHRNGSWCFFEGVITNLLDHRAVRGVVLNCHDITHRVRSEAALLQAKMAAEAANRAKSAFLANIGHELRTPLSVIVGYSDLLLEEAQATGEKEWVRDLHQIRSAGTHLLTLINDLLQIAELEAGQIRLRLEKFNLSTLIENVVGTILPQVERNGNTLEVRSAGNLGAMHADPKKVRQILLHLLGNAAKFTENGKITLAVSSGDAEFGSFAAVGGAQSFSPSGSLPPLTGSSWLTFTVADTGIGIPAEYLPHLFEAFTQADDSGERMYGGTGLGLAITRRLCEMMGGRIAVRSQPGVGSAFTVYLPADVASCTATAAIAEEDFA
ncbi:MAG: PAS domain-containing sensor histidine kinase [Oscillatoria princeps RMCB-10]|jgi:PAS domain S-box-containing protein|nr:PAS domain-containing sensor histidine kinase [Oscillatoria princeps RMCB-10]